MLYLECEVRRPVGMRDSDVLAVVTDHAGGREQIQIEAAFLVERGGRHFLPVWGLVQDHLKNLVEVEFPQESAAGTNRIWVRAEKVFSHNGEEPA